MKCELIGRSRVTVNWSTSSQMPRRGLDFLGAQHVGAALVSNDRHRREYRKGR